MPPIYSWEDENTKKVFEILRPFEGYQEEPKDEDLPEDEKGKPRKWRKILGTGIRMVRGDNWTGSKGNW